LVVPPFIVLDNIVINKMIFKKSDTETLKNYYQNLDKDDIDKELMEVEEFNFYLNHIHSVLEFVLTSDFFEFHK
jgi:hypothetical protein